MPADSCRRPEVSQEAPHVLRGQQRNVRAAVRGQHLVDHQDRQDQHQVVDRQVSLMEITLRLLVGFGRSGMGSIMDTITGNFKLSNYQLCMVS